MKYLVDANILSEPTKPAPHLRVVAWLRAHQAEIVVDPLILGELQFGILLLPKSKKRSTLERWLQDVVKKVHCLTWDADTGLVWADLIARLRTKGKAMPIKDSLIAASAIRHDLTVATHNRPDFEKAGVRIVDPFTT